MKKTFVLFCCALLLFTILWADQETLPSKGRFDFSPKLPQRESHLAEYCRDASRVNVWSTNFTNTQGWTMSSPWQTGMPTMGPQGTPDQNACLATNPNGFYGNGINARAISPVINIPAASYVELSFVEWFELESDYDFGQVRIRVGTNSFFELIDSRSGSGFGEWRNYAIDISRFAGQNIQVVFDLNSDNSVPGLGWYLDSASITAIPPMPLEVDITDINITNLPSVYITAAVTNTDGPVMDLSQSNFSVTENSLPQSDLFSVIAPDDSQVSNATDIVFVLDVTGSMGDEINSVRANMQAFMNYLNSQNMDYRIGFVVFGDIVYVYNQYGFYTNFSEIMGIINNITLGEHGIGGGNDSPENQLGAMAEGAIFNWRPGASRVMIMLTDATSHEADDVTAWTTNNLLAERLIPNNVIVFPVFNVNSPNQVSQYLPIAEQTNPSHTYFHIYDNFNAIIGEVGTFIASLYTIHYRSAVPSSDPMSRVVDLTVQSGSDEAEAIAFYLPGISPVISRTAPTEAYDITSVPANTPLVIEIEIQDRVAPYLTSQIIRWRQVGLTNFQSAPLVYLTPGIYRATLPAQSITGIGVEYYVEASDGQTTKTLPSSEPETKPFVIAINPVHHVVFGNPNISYSSGGPFSLSLGISTNPAPSLNIFYRPIGSLVYESIAMTHSGTNYSVNINQDMGDLGVEWYIVATQTNNLRSYLGNFDEPRSVMAVTQTATLPPEGFGALIQEARVWPNPLSTATRSDWLNLGFSLSREAKIEATIYNLRGQQVRKLASKTLNAGTHTVYWDLKDEQGSKVPAAVYLYRIQGAGYATHGKLLLSH